MASFESKVSEIFNENPRLSRAIPYVIKKLFHKSEFEFKQMLRNGSEEEQKSYLMKLYDILFIDYYYDSIGNRFLNWVIENYPENFTDRELDELRVQALSYLDFYEIQRVTPGEGSYIKSLMDGREGFLKDVSSSSKVNKWDIILSRCYRYRDAYYATGALILFQPGDKKYILERMEQALSKEKDRVDDFEYGAFAKENWDLFSQIERDIQTQASNKKIYTKYGEFQPCDVRFKVNDSQAILKKIDTLDEFNFLESKKRKVKNKNITRYQYDWHSLGIENELESLKIVPGEKGILLSTTQLDVDGNNLGIEVLGSFFIDQTLCRLETRSLELAEFAVRHFNQIFGNALTLKRILKKKTDTSHRKNVDATEQNLSPSDPIDYDLTKRVEEKYYLDLLDEKIPALDNLSPRQARKDPASYPLLTEWLKGLENSIARRGADEAHPELIKKIMSELDIDW